MLRALTRLKSPTTLVRALALVGVLALFGAMLRGLLEPLFADLSTYGFHDWDSHSVYRYVTVLSLKRYHELPWYNPWLCGGFASWGYAEGSTNLVSPYLPIYLLAPIQVALRIEVLGSAALALVGSYLFASRLTKSVALRALVAVLAAVNGRWALQMATGHTWHLQYAWLPLALYFIDVSFEPKKTRYAVYSGICLAFTCFMGGIYPLPHAAIALVLYGGACAITFRRMRPLVNVAIAGLCAVGFAAPKLFPLIAVMSRFPRIIESTEAIDLRQAVLMLADPHQGLQMAPVAVPAYGWHEWGIYIGAAGTAIFFFAMFFGRGPRVVPLRIMGIIFFLLGLGAFLPMAPWTLLHKLPPFSSQHVPSRFLFPAVLFLSAAFVGAVSRPVGRWIDRRPWIELTLLIPVAVIAMDIVSVGRKATAQAFYLHAPAVAQVPAFRQESVPPANYDPPDAWAGASLLSVYANTGFTTCYSVPDRGEPKGARARTESGYQGEAYVADGTGEARVVEWSPNSAEIEVSNASPGSTLVYNMNYEPSWRADGRPALEWQHAVAAPLHGGAQRVRFSYYPRGFTAGFIVFLVTCLAVFAGSRLLRGARTKARTVERSGKPDPRSVEGERLGART